MNSNDTHAAQQCADAFKPLAQAGAKLYATATEAIEQVRHKLEADGYDVIGTRIVKRLDGGQVAASLLIHGDKLPTGALLDDVLDEQDAERWDGMS